MGAKYNVRLGRWWIEFTPNSYLRVNRKHKQGFFEVKYEKWW